MKSCMVYPAYLARSSLLSSVLSQDISHITPGVSRCLQLTYSLASREFPMAKTTSTFTTTSPIHTHTPKHTALLTVIMLEFSGHFIPKAHPTYSRSGLCPNGKLYSSHHILSFPFPHKFSPPKAMVEIVTPINMNIQ